MWKAGEQYSIPGNVDFSIRPKLVREARIAHVQHVDVKRLFFVVDDLLDSSLVNWDIVIISFAFPSRFSFAASETREVI